MMQPMDIKSHSFGTGLFGYKKADVDQYVDTVYRAYDELFTENKSLKDERDRLNAAIEESRLKINELENKLSSAGDAKADDKKADKASGSANKKAADPFEELDDDNGKIKMSSDKKTETVDSSATSKFFEDSSDSVVGDDDDVFVGEIEDNRKPNKVMIGDGEDEGSDDFEFL